MERTVDQIVKASVLPLSIVIVGVGSADFTAMVCKLYNIRNFHVNIHIIELRYCVTSW